MFIFIETLRLFEVRRAKALCNKSIIYKVHISSEPLIYISDGLQLYISIIKGRISHSFIIKWDIL